MSHSEIPALATRRSRIRTHTSSPVVRTTARGYYRARYYSPTYQRFIGQDPIGFAGGGGSLGIFTGGSPNGHGQVTAENLTIGLGGGVGSAVGLTGTRITQFNSSSSCSCR